jgi:hypothetical protein
MSGETGEPQSGRGLWGAEIRFSCCEAVFVDQPAEQVTTAQAIEVDHVGA